MRAPPEDKTGCQECRESESLAGPVDPVKFQGKKRAMVRVYNVMIKCPVTGRPLKTGVQSTSPERFAREVYMDFLAECPHCKGQHRWKSEDTFLLPEDSWCESETLWRPNR